MDEELRRLEQCARKGDERARLQLAHALERAGRTADARTQLTKTPAWCGVLGDAGRTRYLDGEPIRRPPRVQWRSSDPGVAEIASEVGVFVRHGDTLVALDAETGQRRFAVSDVRSRPWFGGGCLLVRTGKLDPLLIGASTGERIAEYEGAEMVVGLADGTWLSAEESGAVLARRRWDGSVIFQTALGGEPRPGPSRLAEVLATTDRILVPHHDPDDDAGTVTELDAWTGDVVREWHGTRPMVLDAHGFIVRPRRGADVIHDAGDPEEKFISSTIVSLGPDFIVGATGNYDLELRDRRTNEHVFELPGLHQAAAVRGTIYRSVGPIVDARALDGTLLWWFDAGARVARLLPFPRRLVLQVEGGVICLAEP